MAFARICGVAVEEFYWAGTGLEDPPLVVAEEETDTEVTAPTSLEDPDELLQRRFGDIAGAPQIRPAGAIPRAWIRIVRVDIASPLLFKADDWGRLAVRFLLRNAGNVPAFFVTTASAILPFEPERPPREVLDAICDQEPGEGQGLTLFPGEEREWSNNVVMDPGAVKRAKKASELSHQKVNVLFAGCVTYRSSGSETTHRTPYLYEVYQTLNGQLVGFAFVDEFVEAVEAGKLSLHPEARWLRQPT